MKLFLIVILICGMIESSLGFQLEKNKKSQSRPMGGTVEANKVESGISNKVPDMPHSTKRQRLGLQPEDVVISSLRHYPKVLQASQYVVQKNSEVQEAYGAFDGKFKGKADSRTEGYYDGDAYSMMIEKEFTALNSRIYGGKRQSYGEFPTYEGKSQTSSNGEFFAGASISLLRDSLIDYDRYKIRSRKENLRQAKVELERIRINVQTLALQAYWAWVIQGHELRIYKKMESLATKRAQQIAKRIKAGDLARIYESENNQYIRKRQIAVKKSELAFRKSSFYLSLFYRDKEGRPLAANDKELPSDIAMLLPLVSFEDQVLKIAETKSLELRYLESERRKGELDIRLGKNQMLPKVNANFEWNQDQGVGPDRLGQNENRIMLNIEIPLEFRKGLGKRELGQAKVAQVRSKEQFVREKLKVQVQTLMYRVNSYSQINEMANDEVRLASKLARAEKIKFIKGASDLLMLNIREENLGKAQVKRLENLLKYWYAEAELRKIQVRFLVN